MLVGGFTKPFEIIFILVSIKKTFSSQIIILQDISERVVAEWFKMMDFGF